MFISVGKISSSRNGIYFCVVFLIYFAFQFTTAVISNHFDPTLTSSSLKFNSLQEEFIITVLIGPAVETLIFQYLIIETLLSLKMTQIVSAIISGLLFGISHCYNLPYILVTTVVGLIFAYYYMRLRHQGLVNTLGLVTLLHALSNIFAFVNNNFFNITDW